MNNEANRPPIDQSRRRLTKAGLAAPAVLGTLASGKVLGAAPWKCTISGQVSGNMSGHELEACNKLGKSPATWASSVASWPSAFKDGSGNPLPFKDTPSSLPTKFADAFVVGANAATVLEVLNGTATIRAGHGSVTLTLGQEVIAAAMNALDGTNGYPAFPVPAADVVEMFNDIDLTPSHHYVTTDYGGVDWDINHVIYYLQSLHI
jgi:hypothetical protein